MINDYLRIACDRLSQSILNLARMKKMRNLPLVTVLIIYK